MSGVVSLSCSAWCENTKSLKSALVRCDELSFVVVLAETVSGGLTPCR